MSFFKKLNIKGKLVFISIFSVIVSLMLFSAILLVEYHNENRRELARNFISVAKIIAHNSKGAIMFPDSERAENVLSSFENEAQVDYAVVYDADDRILGSFARGLSKKTSMDLTKEGFMYFEDHLEVTEFVRMDGDVIGRVFIWINLLELNKKLNDLFAVAGVTFILSVSIIYVLILRLQAVVSGPILSLAKLAENISRSNDFSVRGKYDSKDEMGTLYRGFNTMLEQIQIRDSELRESNEQLIHAEKLAATGKLSASIAHEFNNPICGIRNVLERVDEQVPLPDRHRESVKLAIKECSRIADLIKQLMDFHRPSSGEFVEFDLHEVVDEVIHLKLKQLEDQSIGVEKYYGADVPAVFGVPDQIKQVILNILHNAEDSMRGIENGSIIVKTEFVHPKVKLHIQDTGHGIPGEVRTRIFDPFFSTKAKVKGTGLGLSVSYGIIRNHGGEIVVQSAIGVGTTFSITLRVKAKSA